MRRALLDTDIFSEIAKGKNETVRRRALAYTSTVGSLAISTVTVVEVVKGLRKVGREAQIDRFLASLPQLEVFPLDTIAAEHAGRIYGDLERLGQPVGRADPMIAGIALARGLVLVTGNQSHYERIIRAGHSIEIDDWRVPEPA
ncbi:MAG TPA: PIN domain-containing protein [Polyangia bacterium]|nr:PIN domain-containing protein [Polyangia bacterium]